MTKMNTGSIEHELMQINLSFLIQKTKKEDVKKLLFPIANRYCDAFLYRFYEYLEMKEQDFRKIFTLKFLSALDLMIERGIKEENGTLYHIENQINYTDEDGELPHEYLFDIEWEDISILKENPIDHFVINSSLLHFIQVLDALYEKSLESPLLKKLQ
jgi:hypothetical protein